MSFIVGFPPPTILYRSKECIVCMMSETEVKSDTRVEKIEYENFANGSYNSILLALGSHTHHSALMALGAQASNRAYRVTCLRECSSYDAATPSLPPTIMATCSSNSSGPSLVLKRIRCEEAEYGHTVQRFPFAWSNSFFLLIKTVWASSSFPFLVRSAVPR